MSRPEAEKLRKKASMEYSKTLEIIDKNEVFFETFVYDLERDLPEFEWSFRLSGYSNYVYLDTCKVSTPESATKVLKWFAKRGYLQISPKHFDLAHKIAYWTLRYNDNPYKATISICASFGDIQNLRCKIVKINDEQSTYVPAGYAVICSDGTEDPLPSEDDLAHFKDTKEKLS